MKNKKGLTATLQDMTADDMEAVQVALRLKGLCTCKMCAASHYRAAPGTKPAVDTSNATTAANGNPK